MNEPSKNEYLEIYKLHAELADRVSQRREAANRLHFSLLSGLGLLAGVFTEFDDRESPVHPMESLVNPMFLVVGVLSTVISLSWWIVIRSYQQLNSGKFKSLDELEKRIAFPFFRKEWEALKNSYWKLTDVETILPVTFGILFLSLAVFQAYALAVS